jgi:hypothetical protein
MTLHTDHKQRVSLLSAISHVSEGPQMNRNTSENGNSCIASLLHEFSNGLEEHLMKQKFSDNAIIRVAFRQNATSYVHTASTLN